jgi:hypothetical protein
VYADRELPDVLAPTEGGGIDAGDQWPTCAPDIPATLENDGSATPFYEGGVGTTEVAAVFTGDGGEALAPQGSACASQVYLGSAACDECLREQNGGDPSAGPWFGEFGGAVLPPCSDLYNAGTAAVGPGAGQSRYDLCVAYFDCIQNSACWAATPGGDAGGCECNTNLVDCAMTGGNGVCYQKELAALEVPPGTSFTDVQKINRNTHTTVGHAAGATNAMFADMFANCLDVCAAQDGGK